MPKSQYVTIFFVSIHAPREGCDSTDKTNYTAYASFNSRTPGGVRLDGDTDTMPSPAVSIHAPREGCDGRDP